MTQVLNPTDILLWRIDSSASLIDRAIGWAEHRLGEQNGPAAYYHVGFVSENPSFFYQSKPPKICLTPVPVPLPAYIEVYRLIQPPTPDQVTAIMAYAYSRVGEWYDFLGVLTAGKIEIGGLEFCSQFTQDSFEQGGVVLTPDVRFATPDDIAESKLIYKLL